MDISIIIARLNELHSVERQDCAPGISDPKAVQMAIAELRRLTAELTSLKKVVLEVRWGAENYRDSYQELQRSRDEY